MMGLGSKIWYWFPFFYLTTSLVSLTTAVSQSRFPGYFCSNGLGNYTQNTTYQTNLNSLLSFISDNINPYGFYNASVGQEPDKVSAIVLCRGDIDQQTCRQCVKNSVQELVQVCPNQKEAIGWYDECMLRYSNQSIFGIMTTSPAFTLRSQLNISSNVELFDQEMSSLAISLENEAPWGSGRKFGTEQSNNSKIEPIYALMQCTPDIDAGHCNLCLRWAASIMSQCCSGRQGARVVGPSCSFWYELFPFYNITANLPPSPKGTHLDSRMNFSFPTSFLLYTLEPI